MASFFVEPVLLFCDGTGTISRESFIEPYIFCDVIILFKNVLEQSEFDLRKINRKENMAALLTKPIGTKEFEKIQKEDEYRYSTDWL